MIRKESYGVHWLEFELLADLPKIKHAVFLKHGGHSSGAFSSLNLGYYMGDNPVHVKENITKAIRLLNLEFITDAHQLHGRAVNEITPMNLASPHSCDGLMTDHPGIGLKISHADCQAAIFYDPIKHALSNVHCGWRGNVQNIYAETIQSMVKRYGSKPADILVCISPSLGPERSEFIHYKQEFPETFWEFQHKPNYFNLWALSEWQLKNAGILPAHIQIASISTYANPDDYYSYRRSKTTGCHGTIAFLTK